MGFQGIDIREAADRIIIRASLKDSNQDVIATGSADLMLLRLTSTGGFETFNFTSFTWIGQTSTNSDMFGSMTHQGVGADGLDNTGLWTYVLSGAQLDNIDNGDMLVAVVRHADALPPQQEHEFQYGGGIIADVRYVVNNTAAADHLFQVLGTDWSLSYDNVNKRWVLGSAGAQGGLWDLTITVDDGTDPIPNALVRIKNGTLNAFDTTDVDGEVVFGVTALAYSIAISAPGYFFTPVTYTPSGNASLNYSMTPVTLEPSEAGLTTGFLTAYSVLGVPTAGISVWIAARNENPEEEEPLMGVALPQDWREAVSGVDGVVSFTNLVKGMTYALRRGVNSLANEIRVTIPLDAEASYELPTIVGKDNP